MKKIALIMIFMLLSGCANNDNNKNAAQSNEANPYVKNVKNSTIEAVDQKSGQDIAKRLVSLATSIPNVNDATAVVLGHYAIVGIDIKENLDRSEVGSIKYSVAESLKNDPYGAYAMIVADPDVTARIKEIADDIKKGEPVQGIFNELADITGRIMPEVPADMINPDTKTKVKNPDEKLKDTEEQQLKNEQDEQSNNHLRD